MTFWTFIGRSLCFHARAHLGVVLGAAIGSAALTGALLVGDSVRASLRQQALERVGSAHYLLESRDRVFTDSTNTWSGAFGNAYAVGLHLRAMASAREGAARANQVQLYGVPPGFWGFAPGQAPFSLPPDTVLLNQALAAQLGVGPGETVLLRFRTPSAFSSDTPLSPKVGNSSGLRLKVQAILTGEQFGNFSPVAGAAPPLNAFVRLDCLQQAAGLNGRANFVLVADAKADLETALQQHWSAGDAGLDFELLNSAATVELRSKRIFLEPPLVRLLNRPEGAPFERGPVRLPSGQEQFLFTYLANLLQAGTNTTPYSMVTAAGPPYTPAGMREDEIIVTQWLADDLRVGPGDRIELSYFLPESGPKLVEATNRFQVRAVVQLSGLYADRALMPDFPGIEKAESTRDWDAGFPVDLQRIRPKDEDYWKEYRGTPKAFISLAAGQRLWGNRFGNLTAIRFPVPASVRAEEFKQALEKSFLHLLRPEELGLRFEPVRQQALKAAEQSQDFGQLFLGFSFFLVFAALLLMALLFQFGLEQRAAEVGILLALGFTAKQVRRWLLVEAAALAFGGGIIGALGGFGYAQAMLWGLGTLWRGAVGSSLLWFHAASASLVVGAGAGAVVALVTIWLTLRKQARQPARELLVGEAPRLESKDRSRGLWVALVCGLGAAVLLGWAWLNSDTADPGAFFGAGTLLLAAGLAGAAAWLGSLARQSSTAQLTLSFLGLRGCARRRKRSLASIALLACGSFVIVALGVFRLDANRHAFRRSSGTGGFTLIGESTAPVVHDLNSEPGREFFGLEAKDLPGVGFVPFRLRAGDEASCLNLSRAQQPRLLGVKPELLADRFTFTHAAKGLDRRQGWELLKARPQAQDGAPSSHPSAPPPLPEIPAIGDANSIQWALGKKIGDTLDYTDEHGRQFKVRLVGAVANSILQGSLLIDEAEFVKRFPNESGYRVFLIDAPSNSVPQVSASLSRALQDVGLELTPAAQRLNAFNAVQNTYLGTFQVLGGLGLLLGSAGLGVVVLRNVLERRGELGLLVAVGFRPRALQRLVLSEHGALLGLGLAIGVLAAAVAVLPAVLRPGTPLPCVSLALTLGAVLLNGLLCTWLATRYALRGNLLQALRNE